MRLSVGTSRSVVKRDLPDLPVAFVPQRLASPSNYRPIEPQRRLRAVCLAAGLEPSDHPQTQETTSRAGTTRQPA
jgi:hypothetical protein